MNKKKDSKTIQKNKELVKRALKNNNSNETSNMNLYQEINKLTLKKSYFNEVNNNAAN